MASARYKERRSLREIWRAWSPRRRKVAVLATTIITAGTLIAAAALLFRAPIDGEVQVGDVDLVWVPEVSPTGTLHEGQANCSATFEGDTLVLTVSGAIAGSSCDYTAAVKRNGDAGLKVQDIVFNEDVETALIDGTCGFSPPSGVPGTPNVSFRITVPEGTPAGTYTASAEAGLVATLTGDFDPALCPAAG